MQCKFFRIRSKKNQKYCYCTLLKKEISFNCYRECESKEYKQYKKIKSKTCKLQKLENDRYSIIYNDLSVCAECGLKNGTYDYISNKYITVSKNEVFEGSYRLLSIKYGMICPLCENCHNKFHNDILFNLKYKVMFQMKFIKTHSNEEFVSIFKQNYIYKLKKMKKEGILK